MTITQWNGQPCTAVRLTAAVADMPQFCAYWARHLVGTRRRVVRVNYAGTRFYLDDEDGSGWAKVTSGGGPWMPHSTLAIAEGTAEAREGCPPAG